MIRHIVLFRFKDSANGFSKSENLKKAKALMLKLPDEIPEIVDLSVRFSIDGYDERNYDYVLDSTFKTIEDLNKYQSHPAHVAFGKFIAGVITEGGRASIDYEI